MYPGLIPRTTLITILVAGVVLLNGLFRSHRRSACDMVEQKTEHNNSGDYIAHKSAVASAGAQQLVDFCDASREEVVG